MQHPLHCFAERRRDGSWYAHCVDLTLDAQASSYDDVRKKLDDTILLYLGWSLEHESVWKRIRRPSPWGFRLRYWRAVVTGGRHFVEQANIDNRTAPLVA